MTLMRFPMPSGRVTRGTLFAYSVIPLLGQICRA
jgi:hypothetical protein